MMGRLCFVGLGLGSLGISLQGVQEIKEADIAYLEYYTTPHEPSLLANLYEATGVHLTVVDRAFVEDGATILREAKEKNVVLAVPGDPMIATTHSELLVRAIRSGLATRVVHGSTVASAVASASGLHYYKFSRTVTVTRESIEKLTQAYHVLHENLLEGAHSLLLLEYDTPTGRGVSPAEAVRGLLKAESNFKREVVSAETFGLVVSRLGREDAALSAGKFSELEKLDFGAPPYSLVVPGKLHFTEVEAVSALFKVNQEDVRGNSDGMKRTAQVLVPKYAEKTRRALISVGDKLGPEYADVVENAELYLRDAESFLASGEDELAMLSIGYSEGLLDSLGFAGVVKIDW